MSGIKINSRIFIRRPNATADVPASESSLSFLALNALVKLMPVVENFCILYVGSMFLASC